MKPLSGLPTFCFGTKINVESPPYSFTIAYESDSLGEQEIYFLLIFN